MFRIACNMSVTLLCALGIVLMAILFVWSGKPIAAADDGGPMTQEDFPCQEDEYLGYVVGDYDYVRCINREEVGQ